METDTCQMLIGAPVAGEERRRCGLPASGGNARLRYCAAHLERAARGDRTVYRDTPEQQATGRAMMGIFPDVAKYIDDAIRACGTERVSGESLAQTIERMVAELRELRARVEPTRG